MKVLVTGGSRGIGAGIVKLLAKQGVTVGFTYSSRKEAAKNLLKDLAGDGHMVLPMNLNDPDSIKTGIHNILEKFGGLDGLVNNAGITKDQLTLRMKAEAFNEVLQTNLTGSFLCIKEVLKPMMKARKGSIVNITSVIGHSGNSGQANYAASKAGLEAMTKSIAQELGSRGLRLNCVAPGFIQTEMTNVLPKKQKKAILDKVPLQKFGSVDDIAHAVSFLLGDGAQYITGQTIHVNGGIYM